MTTYVPFTATVPLPPPFTTAQPPTASPPPPFINSVNRVRELNAAISNFRNCYDDLHNHVDSIKTAIASKLPPKPRDITSLPPPPPLPPLPPPPTVAVTMTPKRLQERCSSDPALENLCRTMRGRGLKKYTIRKSDDLSKLREELPRALKLAPDPAKLVLACLRKFYLVRRSVFAGEPRMNKTREALVLILECFLLMMGLDREYKEQFVIEKAVREEAETAALEWRKRMVVEGGVSEACQVDARGLLLFVACFGVPYSFTKDDVRDLVVTANAKEIRDVLRNSKVLMNEVPADILNLLEIGLNHEGLSFPITNLQTHENLGTNRSMMQEVSFNNISKRHSSTKKRKSPPHPCLASIDFEGSKACQLAIESDQHVLKHARTDSPSLSSSSNIEEGPACEQKSHEDDCLVEEGVSLKRSLLEETILEKDSDFVDFYLLNLIEYMLGKRLDQGSKIVQQQLAHERAKLHMFQDELLAKKKLEEEVISLKTQFDESKKKNNEFQNELVKMKELVEEVIGLKTHLEDYKKENTNLGIKIENLIDTRDQLLEKHMHDVEDARVECLTKFFHSVEWDKVLEEARDKYLTIFRDSEEYRDELTQKAAIFYAKGFDVCRRQVFNSQRLPLDFDLSFLDVRADEMGQIPEEFEAPSVSS